jgi:hypothetical protein
MKWGQKWPDAGLKMLELTVFYLAKSPSFRWGSLSFSDIADFACLSPAINPCHYRARSGS